MPFYEYQCSACGEHREELRKITDPPLRKCPACGRNMLRRLLSAPAFRLKGGGWYETDFKADKATQRNLAGEKEPALADAAPADKPKEAKLEAGPKEMTAKGEAADKSSAADTKPKAASEKPVPPRKSTTRRRARK